jgi:hypothetical protein
MKTIHLSTLVFLLGLTACGNKDDTKPSSTSTGDAKTNATAKETATATATATATVATVATAGDTAEVVADPSATLDESAFASVDVPASVSVPTEEDYEGAAESAITTANADTELKKLEKELDAGAP